MVLRYDIVLQMPLFSWGSSTLGPDVRAWSKVVFAGACPEPWWRSYNCTADVLHIVPRRHFRAFRALVGAVDNTTFGHEKFPGPCCFNELKGCHGLGAVGHNCFNMAVRTGLLAVDELEVCNRTRRVRHGPGASGVSDYTTYRLPQCKDALSVSEAPPDFSSRSALTPELHADGWARVPEACESYTTHTVHHRGQTTPTVSTYMGHLPEWRAEVSDRKAAASGAKAPFC